MVSGVLTAWVVQAVHGRRLQSGPADLSARRQACSAGLLDVQDEAYLGPLVGTPVKAIAGL
jgi:hypothetical protein